MIDYEKLHYEMAEKSQELSRKHASIVEDKIKEAIIKYDCKPSQIVLKMYPETRYEIFINAGEFSIENVFTFGVSDD